MDDHPGHAESRQPPLPVQIIEWKPINKISLAGVVTTRLGKHLVLHDCPVLRARGRQWVGMPAKPRLTRDGSPLLGPNGKQIWTPIVSWENREAADRFSQAVLAELLRLYPDALLGDDDHDAP